VNGSLGQGIGEREMKITTFVNSKEDIDWIANLAAFEEVLIEPGLTARTGRIALERAVELAQYARQRNLKPVLVWDVLTSQRKFSAVAALVRTALQDCWAAVRVRDIGVAEMVAHEFPHVPIQLLCEEGSHNLSSLLGWVQCFGSQLQRLILSIELPEQKLCEYAKALPVETEVLAAGRILLFYSPRRLLHKNFENSGDDEFSYREVVSASPDSHDRPFPTVETIHGTLMYLDKDQFIFDKLAALQEAGMEYVRLDMRHVSDAVLKERAAQLADAIISVPAADSLGSELRASWPEKTLAPFFRNNNTTKQFKRLRSPLHELKSEQTLGVAIAVEKAKWVVVQALSSFVVSDSGGFVSSVGDVPAQNLEQVPLLSGELVTRVAEGQVFKMPWIKGVQNGALLLARADLNSDYSGNEPLI
jgi:U32 family peptidase